MERKRKKSFPLIPKAGQEESCQNADLAYGQEERKRRIKLELPFGGSTLVGLKQKKNGVVSQSISPLSISPSSLSPPEASQPEEAFIYLWSQPTQLYHMEQLVMLHRGVTHLQHSAISSSHRHPVYLSTSFISTEDSLKKHFSLSLSNRHTVGDLRSILFHEGLRAWMAAQHKTHETLISRRRTLMQILSSQQKRLLLLAANSIGAGSCRIQCLLGLETDWFFI